MRGKLNDKIQEIAKGFLGREISTAELRLYPYLDYQMKNTQKIDLNKCNQDDRTLLINLRCKPFLQVLYYQLREKLVGGSGAVPSYEKVWFGFKGLSVVPSSIKRRVFARAAPFFNGSYVEFDLGVKVPYQADFSETLVIHWLLTNKSKSVIETENDITVVCSNVRGKKKVMNYDYKRQDSWMRFTHKRAIRVGRLRDIGTTYSLVLEDVGNSNKKGIVCEFTLKDIDEWGLTHTLNLLSVVYAAAGAIVGGLLVAILLKGCGGG